MRRVIAGIAGGLVAVAAVAQHRVEYDTGSHVPVPERARISEDVRLSDVDRGRMAMAAFARCTIAREDKRVQVILGMPLGPDYAKALRSLASPECLAAGQMSFKPILLRGALFSALWQRRLAPGSKTAVPEVTLTPFDSNMQVPADDPDARQMVGMLWFADCVVKRDSMAASDVVTQPIASTGQAEAYRRLTPNLGPCFPQGSTLTLSKPILEGALAEILYRAPTTLQTAAKAP